MVLLLIQPGSSSSSQRRSPKSIPSSSTTPKSRSQINYHVGVVEEGGMRALEKNVLLDGGDSSDTTSSSPSPWPPRLCSLGRHAGHHVLGGVAVLRPPRPGRRRRAPDTIPEPPRVAAAGCPATASASLLPSHRVCVAVA